MEMLKKTHFCCVASFFKSMVYKISSEEKIYHYSIAFGL